MNNQKETMDYNDKDIVFEANAVDERLFKKENVKIKSEYQQRTENNSFTLDMPEEENNEIQLEEQQKQEELRLQKEKEEREMKEKQNTKEEITQDEYYASMGTGYEEEWIPPTMDDGKLPEGAEEWGFDAEQLAGPLKTQFNKNDEEIKKAETLGADEEDVGEMNSFNKELGRQGAEIQKQQQQFKDNPSLFRELKQEEKAVLNVMQKFGKSVEYANRSFAVKGKEVYKGLTAPFRNMSRVIHDKRAEKLAGQIDKKKAKLSRMMEAADGRAIIRRNRVAVKKNREEGLPPVEMYRTANAQRRIQRLARNINNLTVTMNTEKALIDRSIAYEAKLGKKIEDGKLKAGEIKELLDKQPTKEERQVIREEKKLEARVKEREAEERKRDALARVKELKEQNAAEKENIKEVKEDIKQIKKFSVLDSLIANVDISPEEQKAEKFLQSKEKELALGKKEVIELETGEKIRLGKDLTGKPFMEKWNEKEEKFESISRRDTISAFAKDQGVVTRTVENSVGETGKDSKTEGKSSKTKNESREEVEMERTLM